MTLGSIVSRGRSRFIVWSGQQTLIRDSAVLGFWVLGSGVPVPGSRSLNQKTQDLRT